MVKENRNKMMIEFLWKGTIVGRAVLPNFTRTAERHEIARRLRIKRYDEFQFAGSRRTKIPSKLYTRYTAYNKVNPIIIKDIRSYNCKRDRTKECISFMPPDEYAKFPKWVP